MVPKTERTRLMLLSVLRQKTGQSLSSKFRYEMNLEFDWSEFKAQFDQDYGELGAKQLLTLLSQYFGISSMAEAEEAFDQQSDRRRQRQTRY
ncbi:hypothetical protein [Leptolyngbya sp. PCC 6406]|uniref:hypothetical protein n=1 Tax=Leptolyngbya sp. PCC 6406 TaxID=1173264 RepID=UPI0012DCC34E|nr:hypothetical protein [Leptolyngbya sp. PCC 6406]